MVISIWLLLSSTELMSFVMGHGHSPHLLWSTQSMDAGGILKTNMPARIQFQRVPSHGPETMKMVSGIKLLWLRMLIPKTETMKRNGLTATASHVLNLINRRLSFSVFLGSQHKEPMVHRSSFQDGLLQCHLKVHRKTERKHHESIESTSVGSLYCI